MAAEVVETWGKIDSPERIPESDPGKFRSRISGVSTIDGDGPQQGEAAWDRFGRQAGLNPAVIPHSSSSPSSSRSGPVPLS